MPRPVALARGLHATQPALHAPSLYPVLTRSPSSLPQGFVFINFDPTMRNPETGEHAVCRNSNLNEDLGKVRPMRGGFTAVGPWGPYVRGVCTAARP